MAKSLFSVTALLFALLIIDLCFNPTSLQFTLFIVYYPTFFGIAGMLLWATPSAITVICSFTPAKIGTCAKAIGGTVFTLCAAPFFTVWFATWLVLLSDASLGGALLILIAFLAVFLALFCAIPAFSVAVGNILLSISLFLYIASYVKKPLECVKWFNLFLGNLPENRSAARTAENYCFLAGIFCTISIFVLIVCVYKIRRVGRKYPVSTRILATVLSTVGFLQALGALQSVLLYLHASGYTPMRILGLIAASGMLLLFVGVILKIHLPERSTHAKRDASPEKLQF